MNTGSGQPGVIAIASTTPRTVTNSSEVGVVTTSSSSVRIVTHERT